MKHILLSMMLLFIVQQIFPQYNDTLRIPRTPDYDLKSKNQKNAAWVLLGGGTALVAAGLLIGNRNASSFDDAATGAIMGGLGVISALGSIPLFLASGRNHRRAIGTAQIRLQACPSLGRSQAPSSLYPAAYFRISL